MFIALGSPSSEEKIQRRLSELLSDPQGLNSYSYAKNNPILYKDDQGKYFHIVVGAAIGNVLGVGQLLVSDIYSHHTSSVPECVGAGISGAIAGAGYAASQGGGFLYKGTAGAISGGIGGGVGYSVAGPQTISQVGKVRFQLMVCWERWGQVLLTVPSPVFHYPASIQE